MVVRILEDMMEDNFKSISKEKRISKKHFQIDCGAVPHCSCMLFSPKVRFPTLVKSQKENTMRQLIFLLFFPPDILKLWRISTSEKLSI